MYLYNNDDHLLTHLIMIYIQDDIYHIVLEEFDLFGPSYVNIWIWNRTLSRWWCTKWFHIPFLSWNVFFWGYTSSCFFRQKRNISSNVLSTIIYFGAGGSDWLIIFFALVTFCILIDSLGVLFKNVCHKFFPCFLFLITW